MRLFFFVRENYMQYYENNYFKEEFNMKDNTIIKVAAIGFVGLVVVTTIIGASIKTVAILAERCSSLISKRKIKKGMKEGTIIELDGQYYTVEDVEEA